MTELLQAALSPVNLLFSILLMVILLYWMFVILGALDFGSFDVDIDIDADINVDVDTDVEVSGGWAIGLLSFFNFGKVPFMVILTFLTLSMWTISILLNNYIGHGSMPFALAMFIPNLFVSLCITKIVTTPLIPVFKKLSQGQEEINLLGNECKIILPATTTQMGQAEINHNDNILLINIKVSENNSTPLLKGDKGLIVAQSGDLSYYIVHKM